jgi:hypothetical protein
MIAIAGTIVDSGSKRAFQAAAYTATLFTIFFADFYLTKRRSPEYNRDPRSFWMHDGAKVMDKFGISKSETILALQESAPNLTSVYMDRNGFAFPWHKWDRVNTAPVEQFMKDKGIRHVVCETKFIKEAVALDSSIFTNFKIVGEDGQITVMELSR